MSEEGKAGYRPDSDDTRYDLRTKLHLARAHARLGEEGYPEALKALIEIARGTDSKGKKLEGLHPRTQVQAAAALLRSAAAISPKSLEVSGPSGAPVQIDLGLPRTPEEERALASEFARAVAEAEAVTPPAPDTDPGEEPDDDGGS